MPNWCSATIKVRGRKPSVDEFIMMLKRNYNYFSEPPKVEGYHFFRVFETDVYRYENTVGNIWVAEISADCAWSVYVCMYPGMLTYYDDGLKSIPADQYMGTNVIDASRKLNLEIEIFSEELGMCFAEHYRLNGGIQLANEERDLGEIYYLYEDTYKDYLENWGDDDRIHSEEEYQALKAQADDEGLLVTGGIPTEWTMPDKPNYMVNLVACKEVKQHEKGNRQQKQKSHT